MIFHPACEAWRLVVEEYAAIFHGRFAVGEYSWSHIHIVTVSDRRISPPVPRRHTHLPRQLVDAVDSTATVASGNDKCAVNAFGGVVDYLK